MGKRITNWVLGGLFAMSLAGVAQAGPMTWEDTYDTEQFMNSGNSSHSWTWDITDDGFVPGSDLALTYGITLYFGDDESDKWWNPRTWEFASFDQPGVIGDRWSFAVDSGAMGVNGSLAGLVWLNSAGILSVELTREHGDFYFFGGDLVAHGIAAVPEPGTLSLLGLGLLGAGLARRRRMVAVA